jgi:phosphomannomutase
MRLMASELIITVSGLRGIVGENLTPQVAADYGRAFGSFLRSRNLNIEKLVVCLGRDSRPSGQLIADAVTSGLTAVGVSVINLGIVTTPTVGIMVKHLACAGGIIITASHNPLPYNGVKLLLDNAMAPPPNVAEQIKNRFLNRDFVSADSIKTGSTTDNNQGDDVHIEKVLRVVDVKAIAKKQFKVVLDSVNGAGGRPGIKLLTSLGCQLTPVNIEPTGLFAHTPEPTAENLVSLCDVVKKAHADIGFAQDPDADRLAIVDEKGTYIGEEYTLALAAKLIFSKQTGKAAANLSTTRMIDDIAKAAGAKVVRTPVGEANVASAMIQNNCIIGGEGNGGVIDLRIGPIRDSLVSMAFTLQLLAETGKTLSQLVAEIPRYYMTKQKFPADKAKVKVILDEVKKLFPNAKIDSSDGFRFDFPDAWIHIRSSNTEPIVRIIAEGKDKAAADKYIDAVLKIAR